MKKNKAKLFIFKRNSDFVEATMEFGSLVCKPQDPLCNICTLKNFVNLKILIKKINLQSPKTLTKKITIFFVT